MNFFKLLSKMMIYCNCMAIGNFAAAGGTNIFICNYSFERPLHAYRSEGNIENEWWVGSGWYTADEGTCVNTGLTSDRTTVAFAFAVRDDAGRFTPIKVNIGKTYGSTPMSIDAICVPSNLEVSRRQSSEQRNTRRGRACSEGARLVPTSFVAVTGGTAWDEFENVSIDVQSGGREYDLSASDIDWRQEEADRHALWQGYFNQCSDTLIAAQSASYTRDLAQRACACETVVHEYVLSQTELTHEDMDFEYPDPWNDTVKRRQRYPVDRPLAECRSRQPKIDMAKFATSDAIANRLKALMVGQ